MESLQSSPKPPAVAKPIPLLTEYQKKDVYD